MRLERCRGPGGKVIGQRGSKAAGRIGGHAGLRGALGCGLLVALTPPAAQAAGRLDSRPKPPSAAQIRAAEDQVRQHQGALGAQQGRLSAANAALARLQTQAEVLTERYDQVRVNEQRAAAAYRVTQARLRQAERQQAASRQRLAQQADLQAASHLKVAIEAAVARQQAFVKLTRGKRDKLANELAKARATASTLKAERQAALAAQAAATAGAPAGSGQVPSWAWGSGASASQGDIAANWALTQLGKPYQWGGAGPDSYDCSGLAMVAWAHAGVQIAHWTGYQWQSGPHVPLSQLRRGDLLFYATDTSDPNTIHHVAIYIGNSMMVNAPYTGAFLRIDGMYAPGGLIGAVRPAG